MLFTPPCSRLHGPRILLLFQRPSGNYRAGSYLYPLGYVEQQEVTLPGGTRWHSIACERVNVRPHFQLLGVTTALLVASSWQRGIAVCVRCHNSAFVVGRARTVAVDAHARRI